MNDNFNIDDILAEFEASIGGNTPSHSSAVSSDRTAHVSESIPEIAIDYTDESETFEPDVSAFFDAAAPETPENTIYQGIEEQEYQPYPPISEDEESDEDYDMHTDDEPENTEETEEVSEEPPMRKVRREPRPDVADSKPAFSAGRFILSVLMAVLSAVIVTLIAVNTHVDAGTTVSTARSTKVDLGAGIAAATESARKQALRNVSNYVEEVVEAIHYTIPFGTTVAPAPDQNNYGRVPATEAAKVDEIIQQARDIGLLGEQTVVFNSGMDFYHDSVIEYYLDETILVICWRQVIDGNTVTCSEVKIADASQFRRKIADDSFGSANTYYCTDLSRSTNAVVAMNADFYAFRNFGVVVYDGELFRYSGNTYTGRYKNYNCIENLFVDSSGNFHFTHLLDEFTYDEMVQYIIDNDIVFSVAFGPVLVENGIPLECSWYPAGEVTTGYSRAGIGQVDELHYLYMTLDHSPEKLARWTVSTFAKHFAETGVKNAYCLDGGQTGELVMNDEVFNYIDYGSERLVSDMIYFATALPES